MPNDESKLPPIRYGNRKPFKMYNEMRDLERAIRAHDPDATEEAWEKVTQWLDLSFMSLGVHPSQK